MAMDCPAHIMRPLILAFALVVDITLQDSTVRVANQSSTGIQLCQQIMQTLVWVRDQSIRENSL